MPDHRGQCEGFGQSLEALPGIFQILVGQVAGVERQVELRNAQDLAAPNAGKLELSGLRIADGEPEMRGDLIWREPDGLLVHVNRFVGEHRARPGRVDRVSRIACRTSSAASMVCRTS